MTVTTSAAEPTAPVIEQVKRNDDAAAAVDPDDLQCAICLDFYYEPLTLPRCGHSFCRVCLLQSTKQAPDGRSCPQCRSPIGIRDPLQHPEDRAIASRVAAEVSPARIRERAIQSERAIREIIERSSGTIPVFIMGGGGRQQRRPGRTVRLHFFEPRYKILIRRAWEGNRQFLWTDRRPSATAPLSGLLVTVDAARFLPDGRANIVGRGTELVTLENAWVEEGTGGLWYARHDTNATHVVPVPSPVSLGPDEELPLFSFNGLSVGVGERKSFTLFEPRYLILANEVMESNEKLCICASVAVDGEIATVVKMESCQELLGEEGRKRVSLVGMQRVSLTSVWENAEKAGLQYAKVVVETNNSTNLSTRTSGSARRSRRNARRSGCIIS